MTSRPGEHAGLAEGLPEGWEASAEGWEASGDRLEASSQGSEGSAANDPEGRIPAALAGRVRVRVGALVVDRPARPRALLLVEHRGLWDAEPFWTPPGGGVDFGEGLGEALVREVREETGLAVEVGALRYVLDFVRPPLHAVSCYFEAALAEGTHPSHLIPGSDPELSPSEQLIQRVRFVPLGKVPTLRLYPEGLGDRLVRDLREGFPEGTAYLGTRR